MIFVDDGTVDPPGTWTTTTSWREGDPMVGARIEPEYEVLECPRIAGFDV